MRVRPPFGSFLADPILYTEEGILGVTEQFGGPPSKAALNKSLEMFIEEMDKNQIDAVMAPVRITSGGNNDSVAELLKLYPERIIGFAGINVLDDFSITQEQIAQYVQNGDFAGVTIEPGFTPVPYAKDALVATDERIYPIYELCEKNNIPISLSLGGFCHRYLSGSKMEMLDQIGEDFPKLKIICAHGGYPRIPQAFWVAYKRQGIYLSPDSFVLHAGGEQYFVAAKYYIPTKIMFGSTYPSLSFERAIEIYRQANMDELTYRRVMGDNAAILLNLSKT